MLFKIAGVPPLSQGKTIANKHGNLLGPIQHRDQSHRRITWSAVFETFVAIDRASKFAFVRLEDRATSMTARAFLQALIDVVPYRIHTILTDNGI
jgi:hypothetical protein